MESFYAQFEHPTGIFGWFVGMFMAMETRERNAWAVREMNSLQLLLGRTLIVTATKSG